MNVQTQTTPTRTRFGRRAYATTVTITGDGQPTYVDVHFTHRDRAISHLTALAMAREAFRATDTGVTPADLDAANRAAVFLSARAAFASSDADRARFRRMRDAVVALVTAFEAL